MSQPRIDDAALLRADKAYADVDRDVMEAFRRVLQARVCEEGMLGIVPGNRVEWAEFEQELARLCDYARIRHAMKHAAIRAAMYETRPIVVIRDPDGEMRFMKAISETGLNKGFLRQLAELRDPDPNLDDEEPAAHCDHGVALDRSCPWCPTPDPLREKGT